MSAASAAPASPDPYANYRELTLRGMVLGALITVVFTASNVYLGLKVGLTFASSIPAAVISMALLRFARGSNILENNMVQTQASAAGTLSSVIFILPGLLMAGYWSGFPFWQTVLLCTSGGILGVIFTIPLRHAMVVNSPLPYPEGVAAAEILNFLGGGEEATLLETLRAENAELAQEIEDLMFTFDDLLSLDDRAVQTVLREVQNDQLIIALKGAEPALREKIFKNMSSRAAESLKEDLESRGPVRLSEVEAQQKEILKTVKRLADEGTIVVSSGGADALV